MKLLSYDDGWIFTEMKRNRGCHVLSLNRSIWTVYVTDIFRLQQSRVNRGFVILCFHAPVVFHLYLILFTAVFGFMSP
jgi:hypothetical protein